VLKEEPGGYLDKRIILGGFLMGRMGKKGKVSRQKTGVIQRESKRGRMGKILLDKRRESD